MTDKLFATMLLSVRLDIVELVIYPAKCHKLGLFYDIAIKSLKVIYEIEAH